MNNIFKHWKTTLAALVLCLLTFMLYTSKITVTDWALGLGSLGTAMGLLAKDWDKTDQ